MGAKAQLEISRLIPCSVAILTVASKKDRDAMTASTMFISENPPILTVSVAKHIVSHNLIEEAGEFVLNMAAPDQVKLAMQVGFTHGKDTNKFRRFHIQTAKASKVSAPLIKGAFAHLECKVITSLSTASYVVYLAEVAAYKVNQRVGPIAWYANRYFALNEEIR